MIEKIGKYSSVLTDSDLIMKINEIIDVLNKMNAPKYHNGRKTPMKTTKKKKKTGY